MTSDASFDGPPPHDRLAWAQEALVFADLVTRARGEGESWVLEQVLCGSTTERRLPRDPLRLRHEAGTATRVLVHTTRGYVDVSPEGGLTDAEWSALAAQARPREAPSGTVEVEGSRLVATFTDASGAERRVRVVRETDRVLLELEEHGGADPEPSLLAVVLSEEGMVSVRRVPHEGRGFEVAWADGELRGFAHFVDGEREGLEHVHEGSTGRRIEENRYRAGHRHGPQRRFRPHGDVEETVYEDGLLPPVVRPRAVVEGTTLTFGANGEAYYAAPPEVRESLRVGMTLQEVADAIGQPVSERTGVSFRSLLEHGERLELAGGRVVAIDLDLPQATWVDAL